MRRCTPASNRALLRALRRLFSLLVTRTPPQRTDISPRLPVRRWINLRRRRLRRQQRHIQRQRLRVTILKLNTLHPTRPHTMSTNSTLTHHAPTGCSTTTNHRQPSTQDQRTHPFPQSTNQHQSSPQPKPTCVPTACPARYHQAPSTHHAPPPNHAD